MNEEINQPKDPEPLPVKCEWTKKEIHGKSVRFRVVLNDGTATGVGSFFVYRETSDEFCLGLESFINQSGNYKLIPLTQDQVDLITFDPETSPHFALLE